ncbi:60Kd inner membrane protein, putative [Trypanosoma equiperdum]|uniref:60Kd inner membrane protein, putative n=1 Tax=Trypanosoma equiperdum TaxID=5694 RepID=A0A1G4I918_TRYEQ|nr:60Kd inner membrane protein, putative [Trypanosoma equiperdum]
MRKLVRSSTVQRAMPVFCTPILTSRCTVSSNERVTYFDYLDRIWNCHWFGVSDVGIAPPQEPAFITNMFVSFQEGLNLGAPEAILLLGVLCRVATLGFSLYGERASERMRKAICKLKTPHEAYQRVYHSEGATSLDIQLAATALKGERRRVFAEEKTSNAQCLSSILGSPIVLFGMFQAKSLCENPYLEFGTSPFLWCTSLTMPDPYGILPLAFCGLTLANFELSISKELKTGWMSNVVWGARLGCLCVLPVALQFRSGVCLYFLGVGLVGLLQPILLRSNKFRSFFNFPTEGKADTNKFSYTDDGFYTRMSVQFPYVSHLFDSVEEENISRPPQPPVAPVWFGSAQSAMGYGKKRISSPASVASEKRVAFGKGLNFAAPGWKAHRAEFREEDLIPDNSCFGDKSCKSGKDGALKDTGGTRVRS